MASTQSAEPAPIVNEQLDDRVFKFQVYFWNNDGKLVRIPKSTISELVINDTILDWFHYGHLIFNNPKDVFERVSKKYVDGEEIDIDPYRFRNDGRDYLYIEIDVPINDDIIDMQSLDDETFTIKLVCSIYNVEDIPGNSVDEKQKKVHFWDYRQQIMTERNMMWSTAHAVKRQGYTGTSKSQYLTVDDNRTVYTGDAIKDLITECLKTPQTTPQFEDDFSVGGELLFYTSPAQSKVVDDLNYLLDHHVHDSKTAEPCLLRCDRYTDKWSLITVQEFFNRSYDPKTGMPGSYTKDRFTLGDESSPEAVETNELRTPDSGTAKNNFWVDCNTINLYSFNDMSTEDAAMFMNTTAVHMYDTKTKQFNIQVEQSDIAAVKEHLEKTTFQNVLASQTGLDAAFALNKMRTENKNIKHMFTATATQARESLEGRNRTMMAAILNGNSIEFNVKGLPSRQAGKFINIDRAAEYSESDYDNKVLGTYFVTGVSHVISNKGYFNQILATKPYLFKKPGFNEDIT